MARQANILAFEDVTKTSTRSRSGASNTKKQAKPVKRGSSNSNRRPSVSTETRARNSNQIETKPKKKVEKKTSARSSSSRGSRVVDTKVPQKKQGRERPSEKEKQQSSKTSKISDLKRSYSKARADRSFTKQFAGQESSSASSEGAPRAALYKAEMGKSHKRATKAQASPQRSLGRMPKTRDKERFDFKSPKVMVTLVVACCIIAACAFIYPTAQQYYVTSREYDQLQAEYIALLQREETLGSEVASLQTTEGIENRARQEFGWVKEGENAVKVYGLDVDTSSGSFTKSVPAGSVPAPETWYTPFLDFIFNV